MLNVMFPAQKNSRLPISNNPILKLVLIGLLLFTFHLSLISHVYAQAAPVGPSNYHAPQHADYVVTQNLLGHVVPCAIVGDDPRQPNSCAFSNSTGGLMIGKVPGGGALGELSTVMLAMYSNPPVSTPYYLAQLGSNLGLVKPAYAQVPGSGSQVLDPILKLWQVMRNIAYLFFILIFLAVGFMIMFRYRINPQTVVTAQQALPGLIIGLILVTFSYFIASLIVDISFIAMRLVGFIFSTSGLTSIVGDIDNFATQGNVFNLGGQFISNFGSLGKNVIDPLSRTFYSVISSTISPTWNPNIILKALGAVLGTIGGGLGLAVGVLISFVLLVAIVIQMFRLIWALIGAYIAILITTIFGPIIILISAIPGRGGALSIWWKTLLANVLIFPAVFAVFLFAGVFLADADNFNRANVLPLFAGIDINILRAIIGYGIILSSPSVPTMVRQALGVPDMAGGAIGAALGGFAAGFGVAQVGHGAATAQMRQEAASYYQRQAEIATGTQHPQATIGRRKWYHPLFRPR